MRVLAICFLLACNPKSSANAPMDDAPPQSPGETTITAPPSPGAPTDSIAALPRLQSFTPANGASVATTSPVITLQFDAPVTLVGVFTLSGPSGAVTVNVATDGSVVTITPDVALRDDTTYTATYGDQTWSFHVASPFTLLGVSPASGAVQVPFDTVITATATKPFASATFTFVPTLSGSV